MGTAREKRGGIKQAAAALSGAFGAGVAALGAGPGASRGVDGPDPSMESAKDPVPESEQEQVYGPPSPTLAKSKGGGGKGLGSSVKKTTPSEKAAAHAAEAERQIGLVEVSATLVTETELALQSAIDGLNLGGAQTAFAAALSHAAAAFAGIEHAKDAISDASMAAMTGGGGIMGLQATNLYPLLGAARDDLRRRLGSLAATLVPSRYGAAIIPAADPKVPKNAKKALATLKGLGTALRGTLKAAVKVADKAVLLQAAFEAKDWAEGKPLFFDLRALVQGLDDEGQAFLYRVLEATHLDPRFVRGVTGAEAVADVMSFDDEVDAQVTRDDPEAQALAAADIPTKHVMYEHIAHRMAYGYDPNKHLPLLKRWGFAAPTVFQGKRSLDGLILAPDPSAAKPAIKAVVAFRGSKELWDWVEDARQQIGKGQIEAAKDIGLGKRLAEAAKAGGRPDVIGHSLGGALAQLAAAAFPGLVGDIVTFQAPASPTATPRRGTPASAKTAR